MVGDEYLKAKLVAIGSTFKKEPPIVYRRTANDVAPFQHWTPLRTRTIQQQQTLSFVFSFFRFSVYVRPPVRSRRDKKKKQNKKRTRTCKEGALSLSSPTSLLIVLLFFLILCCFSFVSQKKKLK